MRICAVSAPLALDAACALADRPLPAVKLADAVDCDAATPASGIAVLSVLLALAMLNAAAVIGIAVVAAALALAWAAALPARAAADPPAEATHILRCWALKICHGLSDRDFISNADSVLLNKRKNPIPLRTSG